MNTPQAMERTDSTTEALQWEPAGLATHDGLFPLRRTAPFERWPAQRATSERALSPVFGAMRMGAIVTSIDGQVGYLNAAAREALDGDVGLALQGDRVVATSPETRRRFVVALHGACRAPFVDGAVLLGARHAAGAPRPLRVLSMERLAGGTPQVDEGLALLCMQPTRGRTPDAAMLAQLFGLTGAEAMLMAGIAAGQRLHQCAAKRGVSLATVRAQLRNVFVKTGAGTQAELTFIAWSVPGLWVT